MFVDRRWWLKYRGARLAQAAARRLVARRKYLRYRAAKHFQSAARRFLTRCWYAAVLALCRSWRTNSRCVCVCVAVAVWLCLWLCGCACVAWLVGWLCVYRRYIKTLCAILIQTRYRSHAARVKFRRMCKNATEEWKLRRLRRQKSIIIQRCVSLCLMTPDCQPCSTNRPHPRAAFPLPCVQPHTAGTRRSTQLDSTSSDVTRRVQRSNGKRRCGNSADRNGTRRCCTRRYG